MQIERSSRGSSTIAYSFYVFVLFCLFISQFFLDPGIHWYAYRLFLMLASRNVKDSNVRNYEYD